MVFKFEELKVWQEAVKFSSEIYKLTQSFPKEEQFGLISQLNRAAVSISLNIAEGSGRRSDPDLSRFIQISIGSLNEVVTLLHICREQSYISQDKFEEFYAKCEHLSKMLHAFRNYLKL
ncbi:MAG: four helix bundle protein [Candidatus Omnitrophica bacterium]|nr:four helix bundle protein [Candidatus Omnitrophota bacterium]